MAVLIYFSPKIKDISNDLVFKNYNHEFNFPSLPDKITDEINISSDLSKIDLSNNDFLKYWLFIPCETIEDFNNMFDLFKGTKIQSINNNKYIRLRSAILPMKEQNFFSINIDLFFNSENWKLKSLKQMTIKNIWGNNLTYRIKFWYKINEEDEPKMYEFDFNQSLFSKHDQKNTTTITIF